jgi:hypothetical protein
MIDATASFNRRCRVWLDEPSFFPTFTSKVMVHSEAAPVHSEISPDRSVGIEVLIPQGARAAYGYLSIRWSSSNSGRLSIYVPGHIRGSQILQNTLCAKFDSVKAGLPSEYRPAVITGLLRNTSRLRAGEYIVESAAYSDVGSSVSIFIALSQFCSELIHASQPVVCEDIERKIREFTLA